MLQERASAIAENFDMRNLPPDFYANPYPVYDVLRHTNPVRDARTTHAWRRTTYCVTRLPPCV